MKLLTKNHIQNLERQSPNLEELMVRAGTLASKRLMDLSGAIAVVCGPGNNGGDGFVIAQNLFYAKKDIQIILPIDPKTELSFIQFKKCRALGIKIFRKPTQKVSFVIDALFGIGLSRSIGLEFFNLIQWMNQHPVIAIDVPTGLNCDTGNLFKCCVKATRTLTFWAAKPGFFINSGPRVCGKIETLALDSFTSSLNLYGAKNVCLPQRPNQSHKANFGNTLILSGREGFWGSGIMSSSAAFRIGSGYVTWASFDKIPPSLLIPEALTAKINKKILNQKYNAILVGPGLGNTKKTADLLKKLFNFPNVIVDADALKAAKDHNLFPFPKTWLVTPHAGELAYILSRRPKDLEADRLQSVDLAIQKMGCVVLFKGYRSIIKSFESTHIIAAGNSALAKAGSGDVLGGMIAGLCAQGLSLHEAALQGVYIHGRLAEEWIISGRNKNSLLPSDLYKILPKLLTRIAKGRYDVFD